MVCTRAEMSTVSPTYPCTATFCIDAGRPPQTTCYGRVVGLLPVDLLAERGRGVGGAAVAKEGPAEPPSFGPS